MSEQIPFTVGGTIDDTTDGAIDGQGPRRGYRLPRTWTVAAAAVAVLGLGGGAVAYAASQSPSASPGSGSYARPSGPAGGDNDHDGDHGGRFGPRVPHLDGTVKSRTAGKILITDFDGFTRTINVSSATKYSGGITATVATGTRIHADGTIDADGVSLDATSVGTMQLGGPGHHGFGPPMGRGRGPLAPSGSSPTPAPTSS